jgi:hypothetical protein
MKAEVTPQHQWLRQLVGDWVVEAVALPGESPPPPHPGHESVRMLGDVWMLADGTGTMPDGAPARMQMMLGYDPVQRAFVGTWIGSMMNHLWVYRGTLSDDRARLLSLDAVGPVFDGPPGATANYRDQIEIIGPDERMLHGNIQLPDGSFKRFMTSRYRRRAGPTHGTNG